MGMGEGVLGDRRVGQRERRGRELGMQWEARVEWRERRCRIRLPPNERGLGNATCVSQIIGSSTEANLTDLGRASNRFDPRGVVV